MIIIDGDAFESAVEAVSINLRTEKNDDLYEAVSTVILHANPDMGDIELEYIQARVAKMMANKIAYEKIQELKEKRKQEETAKAAQAAEAASNGTDKPLQD